jgi:hypothetical protein
MARRVSAVRLQRRVSPGSTALPKLTSRRIEGSKGSWSSRPNIIDQGPREELDRSQHVVDKLLDTDNEHGAIDGEVLIDVESDVEGSSRCVCVNCAMPVYRDQSIGRVSIPRIDLTKHVVDEALDALRVANRGVTCA